jgi:hypothetical protein
MAGSRLKAAIDDQPAVSGFVRAATAELLTEAAGWRCTRISDPFPQIDRDAFLNQPPLILVDISLAQTRQRQEKCSGSSSRVNICGHDTGGRLKTAHNKNEIKKKWPHASGHLNWKAAAAAGRYNFIDLSHSSPLCACRRHEKALPPRGTTRVSK